MSSDLLDLLRIACGQGKMRLNVWHGAEKGHQANLANSGDGWTVEHDRDPLLAIEKVLRIRFGKMLERKRAGEASNVADAHPAHRDNQRQQLTSAADEPRFEPEFDGDDIREAIVFALSREGNFTSEFERRFIEGVLDALYGKDEQPNLHEIETTTFGAAEPATEIDEFEALL